MEDIIKIAKQEIISLDQIIDEAWVKLAYDKPFVMRKFGDAVIKYDEVATKIFRDYEKKALKKLAELWIEEQIDEVKQKIKLISKEKDTDKFIEQASRLFSEFGVFVQKMELDLGNMRKARGGKSFEKIIMKLLTYIGIPNESPKGKFKEHLKRIDIIVPNAELAIETPDKSYSLTCKRTLRERWKQEVPQARLNQRIYLLTMDPSLSLGKANEINEKGLIAYVPDSIAKSEIFKKLGWIRKLSELPKELNKVKL